MLLLLVLNEAIIATSEECAPPTPLSRLITFGLVADSHYDTFPAGEKAPWEPMKHWLQEQAQRTTTHSKRRYDVAKDKMEESVEVFNKLYHDGGQGPLWPAHLRLGTHRNDSATKEPVNETEPGRRMDMVVNLGDLVNNDLMWNLRPVLDVFNRARAAHYHLLGNHDLRAHNDRFGKVNLTQQRWIQRKMLNNLGSDGNPSSSSATAVQQQPGWHFSIRYPPFFRFVFIDSMVMEPETPDKRKRDAHLAWLRSELQAANDSGTEVVILFAHIPIGVETNVMGPTIRAFDSIVIAAFFGHNHKGGYLQQGNIHSITINGQIETLVNAFAVAEVFPDRLELTGFGRVPSRVLKVTSPEALRRLSGKPFFEGLGGRGVGSVVYSVVDAEGRGPTTLPLQCWWLPETPTGDAMWRRRPDLRHMIAEPQGAAVAAASGIVATNKAGTDAGTDGQPLRFQPLPPPQLWRDVDIGREHLQKPPPLLLNIPSYKKPVLPYVDANPGGTDLYTSVINKQEWRSHRKRVAPAAEDPVQLNDAVVGGKGAAGEAAALILKDNTAVQGIVLNGVTAAGTLIEPPPPLKHTEVAADPSVTPVPSTLPDDGGGMGHPLAWMAPSVVALVGVVGLVVWRRMRHGGRRRQQMSVAATSKASCSSV